MPRSVNPSTGLSLLILLALLLGAAGPAQAAPPATFVEFLLSVAPRQELLKPICIGQTLTLYVNASRETTHLIADEPHTHADTVIGLRVTGTNDNPNAGTLTLTSEPFTGGSNLQATQAVEFTFTGKKKGTSTLNFEGTFNSFWVPGNAQLQFTADRANVTVKDRLVVKVVPCKVKAKLTQRWSGPGYTLVGTMDETELTSTDGGAFAGAGTVTWVASTTVPECVSTDTFLPSPVTLDGTLNDDGQLAVNWTFDPAEDHATLFCESPGRGVWVDDNWTVFNTPDPLVVVVDDDGGTTQLPQRLAGQQADAYGTALVTLEVIDDEAAAAVRTITARPLDWLGLLAALEGARQ